MIELQIAPEPCKVQALGPESNVVQGCHAPHVVHDELSLPAVDRRNLK